MRTFDIRLEKAVSQLTDKVRTQLLPDYAGREMLAPKYYIKLWTEQDTFVMLAARFSIGYNLAGEATELQFNLSKELLEGKYESYYSGVLVITQNMTPASAMTCAAHLIGDYCKAAFGGVVES